MTLIKSISGIRGTIGGTKSDNLTPIDIVECASGYGQWIKNNNNTPNSVVIGRDGRISGPNVSQLVVQTLLCMGINVIDLDLSTTPTVEVAVPIENAGGGIIITASHNPQQWNALKFLNEKGEFISKKDGDDILKLIDNGQIEYCQVEELGTYVKNNSYIQRHIDAIMDLKTVDQGQISSKKFKVVVDCVNSTGAISIPPLLEQLGCECILLNGEINGKFAHNPEPLPQNLIELCETVKREGADLGVAVDPDVDRLALVDENGVFIGEEYTIVMVADYLLGNDGGHLVSNMSSSGALRMLAESRGATYSSSEVGEVNVVLEMKKTNALFGGEGNGGVIYPELHYGRDSLVGIALVLSHLAQSGKSVSQLRASYPHLEIVKEKISLTKGMDIDGLLSQVAAEYAEHNVDSRDGVKIIFGDEWVHLRKSNTEPIIRVYAESSSAERATQLANEIKKKVSSIV